jgi:mRNA interferase RelE/StbE
VPYRIELRPAAQRELRKLDLPTFRKVDAKIQGLADNPRPHGVKKLAGEDAYRVRVGDYRILYQIEDAILLVVVVTVGNRRDVYRR